MFKHVCGEAFKIVMHENLKKKLSKELLNLQGGPCNDRNVSVSPEGGSGSILATRVDQGD